MESNEIAAPCVGVARGRAKWPAQSRTDCHRWAARRCPKGSLVWVEKSLPVRYLLLSALNHQEVRQLAGRRSTTVCLVQAKRAMVLRGRGILPGWGIHCMHVIRRNGFGTLGGADFNAFCIARAGKRQCVGQCWSQCKQQGHEHSPPHSPWAA